MAKDDKKKKSKVKNTKKSSDDNVPRGSVIIGSNDEIEINEDQPYFEDDFW